MISFSKAKLAAKIKDWAQGRGELPPSNRRVQIKMPDEIVKQLDELYPHADRSEILTKLALQAIYNKIRFIDRPELGELSASDQDSLDTMWDYLEKRDAGL